MIYLTGIEKNILKKVHRMDSKKESKFVLANFKDWVMIKSFFKIEDLSLIYHWCEQG